MASRLITGGLKEFSSNKNEPIEDTESSLEFKEAYKKWSNRPFYKRRKFWNKIIIIIIAITMILAFLFISKII